MEGSDWLGFAQICFTPQPEVKTDTNDAANQVTISFICFIKFCSFFATTLQLFC